MIDVELARKHIRLLFGAESKPAHFQTFFDPKNQPCPRGDLHQSFYSTLGKSIDFLNWAQSNNCGVYVTVNTTDGLGRREENITGFNHVFIDRDNLVKTETGLPPTFTTKRDESHGHDYWKLSEEVDRETWLKLQKRLQIFFGSDPQVVDVTRVLRLAGTFQLKDPTNPKKYIICDITNREYSVSELEENFQLSVTQEEALRRWVENKDGVAHGAGFTDEKRYIEKFKTWCTNARPAQIGSGTKTLYDVACYAIDYGISYDIAVKILWEIYNPRCLPPWTEGEKDNPRDNSSFYQVVKRAYKHHLSAPGCKTTIGVFSGLPKLPERTDGWMSKDEKITQFNKEVIPTLFNQVEKEDFKPKIQNHRICREEAIKLMAQFDSNTPDYDMAVVFDGLCYNGENIIRSEKTYYEYGGGIWKEVSDDVVKARIQRVFAHYSPPNSKVSSIFQSHCDLCNSPMVENGTWLVESDINPKHLSVYTNGVLNIESTPPVLMEHTNKLFTFNKREYEYNPDATCPKTEAFLMSSLKDEKAMELAFEWLGYLLTNNISLQKMMLLIGKSRSGKGVWVNLMRQVIGANSTSAPPLHTLHTPSVLNDLSDKAAFFCGDARTPKDTDTCLSIILQITGCDPITWDRKYKTAKTGVIPARMTMSANLMPAFIDATGALSKRLLVLYFPESFYGRENPDLYDELLTELPGISVRAINAYKRMIERGKKFTQPEQSSLVLTQIKDEMFKLSGFVEDMCELNQMYETESSELYKYYKIHSNIMGVSNCMTNPKMNRELSSSDLPIKMVQVRKHGFRVNIFQGIRINPKVKADLDNVSHVGFKNVK